MKSRTDKLTAGFLSNGFEYNGRKYSPLTARTLLILERVKSPFFTGSDEGMRGLIDFLFASSEDKGSVLKLSKNADSWENAVLDFADGFTPQDLEELGKLVSEENENITAAVVEVRGESGSKKKQARNPIG